MGLVWICHGQIYNYLEERSLTTITYKEENNAKFPNILFCSNDVFKPNYLKQKEMMKQDQQIYDQYVVPINIKLSKSQQFHFDGIKLNYTMTEIYTEWYGKCQVFQFLDTFESRKWLVFEALRNESNYLMVIPPGTEIFFNYDWLFTSPTAIQINSDINVNIHRKRYERVHKKSKPCGEGINLEKFISCMKEDFIERLNNNNATFQCLSFYEHNILRKEFPNVPVCNSSQAYKTHELFLEVIDSYARTSNLQKCSLPCIMDDINYNSAFSKGTGTYDNLRIVLNIYYIKEN